tara:strand:+ start:66 stop:554 length:489 start_codon:yes stop_codon:yes gene_type:complete
MTETIKEIFSNAINPMYKGKKMTTRKVLNLGKKKYFWNNDEVKLIDIPYSLLQTSIVDCSYDCGLVNIYEAQTSISSHTDTPKGMNIKEGVYSISFGITEDLKICRAGTILGSFWIEKEKHEIKSGCPIIFDGYNKKHRASTFKSKIFKYRLNITLRKLDLQ